MVITAKEAREKAQKAQEHFRVLEKIYSLITINANSGEFYLDVETLHYKHGDELRKQGFTVQVYETAPGKHYVRISW